MDYRNLGKSGLKISELSLGSWLTFGGTLNLEGVKECVKYAFDQGVNFFDTAEEYGGGESELLLGESLKGFRREQYIVSSKIFHGGKNPNDVGLSKKHLFEGVKNSLRRLQLDYVDLLFCHSPDPTTPIEETVRAMDQIIRSGQALYWGTSEWSREEIEEAHKIAREIHAIPPTMEQVQYNMFFPWRVEGEYLPLYEKFGMGITTYSPLRGGLLSGKYRTDVPKDSRLDRNPSLEEDFNERFSDKRVKALEGLQVIAKELGVTLPQLAISWCLKNSRVSSVICGASNINQLRENLSTALVKSKITDDLLVSINSLLCN